MLQPHHKIQSSQRLILRIQWDFTCLVCEGAQVSLVENMVKKNCSRFFIVVLLTTLICSKRLHICFLGFTTVILRFWGHVIHGWKGIFKTYLAVYLKTPKSLKFQLVNQKNKYAIVYWLQIMVVQKTAMGKRLWFFFTMFLIVYGSMWSKIPLTTRW